MLLVIETIFSHQKHTYVTHETYDEIDDDIVLLKPYQKKFSQEAWVRLKLN